MQVNKVHNQPNFKGLVQISALEKGQLFPRIIETSQETDVLVRQFVKEQGISLDEYSMGVLSIEDSIKFAKQLGAIIKYNFEDILSNSPTKRICSGLFASKRAEMTNYQDVYVDLMPFPSAKVRNEGKQYIVKGNQ